MEKEKKYSSPYEFEGRIPLGQAIPMGLQHVLAMFVGNLTPILIITGACGAELAGVQVALLQNAMLVAGIVTLVQLFAIGPCGGLVSEGKWRWGPLANSPWNPDAQISSRGRCPKLRPP